MTNVTSKNSSVFDIPGVQTTRKRGLWKSRLGSLVLQGTRCSSAVFTANGKSLIAHCDLKTRTELQIWDHANHRLKRTIRINNRRGGRHRLSLGPRGKQVILVRNREPRQVEIWDIELGKSVHSFPQAFWIMATSYSSDGKSIAVAGRAEKDKSEVRVYELATGKVSLQRVFHANSADVIFTPKGKRLIVAHGASSRWAGAVSFWDLHSGRKIYSLPIYDRLFMTLQFNHNGRVLSACGTDDIIRIWDARQ